MNTRKNIQKLAVALLLLLGMEAAYASFSFTGIADEKTKVSKYSLKNLNSLSHKGLTFSSLKSTLQFKGITLSTSKETNNGTEVSSMLRFDNGNTSYVYPYKFKVKAPKFKTPAPPQQ